MVEFHYIDWTDYGKLVAEFIERIRSRGQTFDLIIGIARGGIPVAMVIADQLEVQIDFINVKSYTGVAAREKPRIVSTLTEDVKGKRVLVVGDLIDDQLLGLAWREHHGRHPCLDTRVQGAFGSHPRLPFGPSVRAGSPPARTPRIRTRPGPVGCCRGSPRW